MYMKNTIFLTEALKIMHSKNSDGTPVHFDVEIREFSRQNKTGGKYKIYNDAKLLSQNKSSKKGIIKKYNYTNEKDKRKQNHWENRTRNLELANGEIKRINILFIIKFNGKNVIY